MQARYPQSSGAARPATALPAGACDCHIHAYDARYPVAAGATLTPPDAAMRQYREIQARLGTQRVVLVTPSTYGADNRSMQDALAQLGGQARGVAVIEGGESDAQLQVLHDAGVCGIRLNLSLSVTSSAEQIAPLGWHVQLLMSPDRLAGLAHLLADLPVSIVFDHMARLAPHDVGTHPAHALVLRLLERRRAWVKLSGGYIVSTRHAIEDPGLDALARSFLDAHPDRVVWGSDWPHASASAALPHVQTGAPRALAATSAQRLPALPDVPTMAEAGFNDFMIEQWQAVFAPAATPAPVIDRLNASIGRALQSPALLALSQQLGITLVGGGPQALDQTRKADFEKWGKVIRDAGIKPA